MLPGYGNALDFLGVSEQIPDLVDNVGLVSENTRFHVDKTRGFDGCRTLSKEQRSACGNLKCLRTSS